MCMAANHPNLRNTLLEIGAEGNLSIFSDGKSIVLSTREVEQVVNWLSQEQKEKRLIVDTTRLELDTHWDSRTFSERRNLKFTSSVARKPSDSCTEESNACEPDCKNTRCTQKWPVELLAWSGR